MVKIEKKEKRQYFSSENYDVLENKSMIHVFKKTFWNKHLKYWKGFAKEYYKWIDDEDTGKMYIIIEKKEVRHSSH